MLGTVSANRNHTETEPLVGFLVNPLAVRSQISSKSTFESHFKRMRDKFIQAAEHQDVPFELLIERLEVDRRSDYQAVFQTLFVMQTAPKGELSLGNATAERVQLPANGSMFDLSLEMWDSDRIMRGELEYSTDLFCNETASLIVERFKFLIDVFLKVPNIRLLDAPLIPSNEGMVLADFSQGPSLKPSSKETPLSNVLRLAQTQPDTIAFEGIGPSLSYGELADRISSFAGHMACMGVTLGSRVGILVNRSPLVAVAYLAAHWLGAIPIYIDPNLPPARRDLLAKTIGLNLSLCSQEIEPPNLDDHTVIRTSDVGLHDQSLVTPRDNPCDPAYATFTSGTTGSPKVVKVSQAALTARICANDLLFGVLSPGTRFAHCYTFNYDGGLSSLFWPLARGATIVFLPLEDLGDGSALGNHLIKEKIAVLDTIPAALASLYSQWPIGGVPELKLVVTGGDICSHSLVSRHFELTNARFANQYGPCEAVINATTAIHSVAPGHMTIGRPIAGVEIFVLDRTGSLAPIGVPGEILIGGAFLSDGYLDDSIATNSQFPIIDPDGNGSRRFYRSGDLGRWLNTGELEFLGRVDRQVQINGMRVDPSEIEATLSSHELVESSHVHVNRRGALTGFVVTGVTTSRNASEHCTKWRELFNGLYKEPNSQSRNFTGWSETATGEDIPSAEMDIWLEETLSILRRRPFHRVLEIGSGLGLIALELAFEADFYLATDNSEAAVSYLEEETLRRGLNNVTVRQVDATTLTSGNITGSFDLIIVNSVFQYFPDLTAVEASLSELHSYLAPGGRLFIGDIRDFRLRDQFYNDVIRRRLGVDKLNGDARRLVMEARMHDEELHLAPQFFVRFAKTKGFPGPPSITLKQAFLNNELSNFRYDVLYDLALYTTGEKEQLVPWSKSDSLNPNSWQLHVGKGPFRVANVPNKRICNVGLDPADFLLLGQRLGREVIILVCADSGSFDVALLELGDHGTLPLVDLSDQMATTQLANDPLLGMRERSYKSLLIEYLHRMLPAHMVPSRLKFVDKLPTKPGGKIDDETLDLLDEVEDDEFGLFVENDLAFALMSDIWDELLLGGPYSRNTDFFSSGGHSLLAAQLTAMIRREFGVSLPVIRVFELRQFGALVDEVLRLSASRNSDQAQQVTSWLTEPCDYKLPSPTQIAILQNLASSPGISGHIGFAVQLKYPLNVADIEFAINRAIKRHPLLVRRYDLNGKVTSNNADCFFTHRHYSRSDVLAESNRELILSKDGPFKLTTFGFGEKASHIVFRGHPFAFDSLSLQILLRDMVSALRHEGEKTPAPDLR